MDLKLALIPGPAGFPPVFDLAIENGDLALDDGLTTALIVSLFSDRRATADDVPPGGDAARRGWWGDSYLPDTGDLTGSRLWLLERERDLPNVPGRAKLYDEEAVKWLLDDGVAQRVECAAQRLAPGILSHRVTVYRPGQTARQYQFQSFWGG